MTYGAKQWAARRAVHASRRQVPGLEEDHVWRAFLGNVTGGQTSVSAMTLPECGKVLDALRARGARSTRPRLDEAQLRMARGLWIELHKAGVVRNGSDAALDKFAHRQTKAGRLEWCGPDQANKVIEALKDWSKRAGVAIGP